MEATKRECPKTRVHLHTMGILGVRYSKVIGFSINSTKGIYNEESTTRSGLRVAKSIHRERLGCHWGTEFGLL